MANRISELAAKRFVRHEPMSKRNNTEVVIGALPHWRVSLYLHGNCIAHKDDHGVVYMSLCGWNTLTTRARLNALCVAMKLDDGFHTKRGQCYYGSREIGSSDLIPVNAGLLTRMLADLDRTGEINVATLG